jgi:hypothetical protein
MNRLIPAVTAIVAAILSALLFGPGAPALGAAHTGDADLAARTRAAIDDADGMRGLAVASIENGQVRLAGVRDITVEELGSHRSGLPALAPRDGLGVHVLGAWLVVPGLMWTVGFGVVAGTAAVAGMRWQALPTVAGPHPRARRAGTSSPPASARRWSPPRSSPVDRRRPLTPRRPATPPTRPRTAAPTPGSTAGSTRTSTVNGWRGRAEP